MNDAILETSASGKGHFRQWAVRCRPLAWGDHLHPQRRLVHFHHADPVDEPHGFEGPAFFHFAEDQLELVLNHRRKRFVFEGGDGLILLVRPHHTAEIDRRAHARGHRALRDERGFVNGLASDGEKTLHS